MNSRHLPALTVHIFCPAIRENAPISMDTGGKETLQEEGNYRDMVIDFGDVKKAVRDLADSYDHALIYEEGTLQRATVEALLAEGFRLIAVPFRPTAEQFSKCFYEKLSSDGLPVRRVAVYETPENCAVYEV